MADKAVSELIEAERITSTDLFVLEQNGTAKKLTGQVLLNWLTAAADGHGGIQSIQKVGTSGLTDTYRITLADTTTFDFVVTNGKSVENIKKTGTSGLVDTYTISYNDGTSGTFTVTNGAQGPKGDNQYVWIKYASQQPTASSHSFGDVPDNWIGIYSGGSATAPTDWQQYKWFQIKGEPGNTGAPAALISSAVEYQVSDSGTIIPSGAWSASVPVVAQGKYLWTRTTNTFNTGSPVVAYSVSRMGMDGSGSVSSVAGVSPGPDGNVPLTAEKVGAVPSAGGDMTGELRMNGQPISGLNMPTANDQAANMGYVNQQVKKAAPRNLLDNSYWKNFSEIVNQRGIVDGNVTNGYWIDRWKCGNTGTVTFEDGYITISANVANPVYLMQISEFPFPCTVCVTTTDGDFVCNFSGNGRVTHSNGWYVQIADGKTLSIMIPYGSSLSIAHLALYEGEYTAETLPEYQPKGYGNELRECLRYLYPLAWPQKDTSILAHPNSTGDAYYIELPFPLMRYTPSLLVLGSSGKVRLLLQLSNYENNIRTSTPEFFVASRSSMTLKLPIEPSLAGVVFASVDTVGHDTSLFACADL